MTLILLDILEIAVLTIGAFCLMIYLNKESQRLWEQTWEAQEQRGYY